VLYGNDYSPPALLVPIIWNFRHAFELALKSLSIAIDKTFLPTHDLDELFRKINNSIASSGRLREQFTNLEELKNRYHQSLFPLSIIFSDKQNESYRFPEADALAFQKVDWSVSLKKIKEKDILIFQEDMRALKKILGIIFSQISLSK
jgi:hypothetical protein